MKVLLVSANTATFPHAVYPLGLDHVAAAIDAAHEVRIADVAVPGLDLAGEVRAFAPDVVGISIRNIDNCDLTGPAGFVDEYRRLARTVRDAGAARIVLGGAGFSIFPSELLGLLEADFGIVGEGARLAGLLDALEQGGDPSRLPGVVVRGGPPRAPEAFAGALARRIPSPGPVLDHYLSRGAILNLRTQQGCPFRCIYCTYPHVEGAGRRFLEPREAGRQARALQGAGARFLFITDSVFNADAGHSLAVAEAMKAAGVTIPWGGFFSPLRPEPDYYRRLAARGLSHVEFGTDALSDPVLAAYRKPFRVEDVHAAHRAAREAKVHVAHYLALGGPGETAATLAESLDAAERLDRCAVFFFAGLRLFPHTELYDRAVAEGQVRRGDDLLTPVFYEPRGLPLAEMLERVAARAKGRRGWIVGSGGETVVRALTRFYDLGHSGPLWERLIG